MAGHSHWKQIKHNKGDADKKRGAVFSKLLRAISAAAHSEQNPQFNPRLRTAIEKAREANVPGENIERAVKKTSDEAPLEEMTMEAYGPGGVALLIRAITTNKNRTVQETKLVLKEHGAKWAEHGSVRWAFEETAGSAGADYTAKFTQAVSLDATEKLSTLLTSLEALDDIQCVFHNKT